MYRSARFALALAFATAAPAWAQEPTVTPVQSKLGVKLILTVAERKADSLETSFRNITLKERDLAARIHGLLPAARKTALGPAQGTRLVLERLTAAYPNDAEKFRFGPVSTWLVSATDKEDVTELFDAQNILLGFPDTQIQRRRPLKALSGAVQVLPDLTMAQGIIAFDPAPLPEPTDPTAPPVGEPFLPHDDYLAGVLTAQQNLTSLPSTRGGLRVGRAARKNTINVLGALLFDLNGGVGVQAVDAIARGSFSTTTERPVSKALAPQPSLLAPTADAGAALTAPSAAGIKVKLVGAVTPSVPPSVPPAPPIPTSIRWTQIAGPVVTITDADKATAEISTVSKTPLALGTKLTFQLAAAEILGGSAVDTVTVTIAGAATAPTANAGDDQTVDRGTAVTLTGTGTDPDGSTVTFAWAQTSPAITLTGAATATPSFTAPVVTADTDFVFTLTVKDGQNQTATDTVTVKVVPKDSPVADATATPAAAISGATVTLNGSASRDPDGGALTFAWSQVTPTTPPLQLTTPTAAQATFVAPTVTAATPLTFRLTVTDDERKTATKDVIVTISPAPAGSGE